jgi:hypothetical protein
MRARLLSGLATLMLLLAAPFAQADLARVGPSNVPAPPGHGFPRWYQDLNGLVLDLCMPDASDPGALQQTACLLGPPNPPYTFPTNFPDEAFYFRAVSAPLDLPNGKRATLVLALEAAFANGVPAAGDQMVFTRIRVTAGVPFDGTYRVTHPYGVEVFPDVQAGAGNRDITFTEDIGISPGVFTQALTSRVGPFLQRGDAQGTPLGFVTLNGAQFLSDGVALETITGSPFGTNYFEICGPLLGPGTDSCVRTNQFTLTGRVHNSVLDPIGSPLSIDRATYVRDSTGLHIDIAASAAAGIGQAAPKLSAGAPGLPPVLMSGPNALGQFYAQALPLPAGTRPGQVTVINSADVPPSAAIRHIVDEVTVTLATYDPTAQSLVVVATSSDKGDAVQQPPKLALEGFPSAGAIDGAIAGDPASMQFTVAPVAVPPTSVSVVSAAGGQGRLEVSMLPAATAFPAGVPLAIDDAATAVAGGPAIIINVKNNDVANAAAPIAAGAVSILAPGLQPAIGTLAALADGTVRFTPTTTTGTATFRYTVANSVGVSNVATVTISVTPPAGGPVPIANPDSGIAVNAGTSRVIDVLANDSANGGTLNPATVTIKSGPTAGTASVNTSTGTITFNAPATPATVTLTYTVKNTNGNESAPATVTINVVAPESIAITRARCSANAAWDVRGTSTVIAGNSVTLYLTATVPDLPTSAQVLGTAPIDATGAFQFQLRGSVPCTSPISLKSALGTKVNNITVQLR